MTIGKQPVARMRWAEPCVEAGIREAGPGLHNIPSGLRKKQRGISLIIVIFLLAVVSVLTVSMVNLSGTQHISSLYSLRNAQAYFAARAGMEYATALIIGGANCPIASPGTIEGYTVTIDNCSAAGPFNEGNPTSSTIFQLTVTASSGNFQVPDVANRRITATVRRTP